MIKNNYCPVCGYDLGFPAWKDGSASDEMCPSCGIQFGLDDARDGDFREGIYHGWRTKWSLTGYKWSSSGMPEPEDWDPVLQLNDCSEKK